MGTPLHAGLPTGSVSSLAEHPGNPDLLFVGTEHALFASTDAGDSWARVPNLPTTAYDDILIHPRDGDLVIGTHGRGIWILDDVGPLAEWTGEVADAPAHLFGVSPATIFVYWKDTSYRGNAEYAGQNPTDGALVTYALGPGDGSATLSITNAAGAAVREISVPAGEGLHRVNWDLRWGTGSTVERWERFEHPTLARPIGNRGAFVSPGSYTVTLEARGTSVSSTVEVLPDPLSPHLTLDDYREREAFLLEAFDLVREIQSRMRDADPEEQTGLRQLQREVQQVVGGMNGGGVRPGTIHPPTETQRERVRRARAALDGGQAP